MFNVNGIGPRTCHMCLNAVSQQCIRAGTTPREPA